MISKDKQYTTRDGREVRVYAVDGEEGEEVHAAFKNKEGSWHCRTWGKNGAYSRYELQTDLDLIEKPEVIEGWLNIYGDGTTSTYIHKTKKDADMCGTSRVKKATVFVKYTIGEGLDHD